MTEAARSLRATERFLLTPPLAASFGGTSVAVCDLSARGARFRHDTALEMGAKAILRVTSDLPSPPLALEAIIVWSHADSAVPGKFVSGVRAYGPADSIHELLSRLQSSRRAQRIEELRSTERFTLTPPLAAQFDNQRVDIEDLSARGARLALGFEPLTGSVANLFFRVPDSDIDLQVLGQVAWTSLRSIHGAATTTYRAGIFIDEKPERMRLAIGRLMETGRAALDAHSLGLKLRILRARARQMAPACPRIETSGIPPEQYLLIQGIREELRRNPEEAMYWYRRARTLIGDPATPRIAGAIANHPDALAVWEYLERSMDPSIVGRAFEL